MLFSRENRVPLTEHDVVMNMQASTARWDGDKQMNPGRLRVAVAAPLSEENCARIVQLEPRIDLIRDQTLYPPMRHPADFSGDPSFRRSASQQDAYEHLFESADVLYGVPDLDPVALKRVADTNPRLRWVHTMAAGGGTQVKAAGLSPEQLRRIAFTTSAGVHGEPLAEFAVFGLLAGAKNLPRLIAQQHTHTWSGRWEMRQISDFTVLLLGVGGIGAQVAQRLSALGATVIGCSRSGHATDTVDHMVTISALPRIVGEVDAIVVTLPETDATLGLVDAQILSKVRPGTILVNVGRGTVVDEDALLAAVRSGRIGFAALDVVAVEPLSPDSPLWDEPSILISPHTAALRSREDSLIAELFAENATRFLDGRQLINEVNTVDFY